MILDVLTSNNRYVKLAVQEVIDMKRTKLDDRLLPDYTRGEEIFNMVTHIVGGCIWYCSTSIMYYIFMFTS